MKSKAFAYKLKMDALSHQGTSCQLGTKLRTDETIGESVSESARQVQRYIRLTELIPEILSMVDAGTIALTPAVEMPYLTKQEQNDLLETMESEDCTPSLSQAVQLKKISFRVDDLRKFFPKSYSAARIQETILKLLSDYQRKRQRTQER